MTDKEIIALYFKRSENEEKGRGCQKDLCKVWKAVSFDFHQYFK